MAETLVHFVCTKPKKENCIELFDYSVIERDAFKNSTVENILLNITKIIEQSAFENCKELKFVAWVKNSAWAKPSQTFFYLNENFISGFETVTVAEGKGIIIQNSAFKGCDKLDIVIFPENKCIIEKDAFAHCKSLRTVILPGGDTKLYDNPFIGCRELTIVCKKDDNELCAYARAHNFKIIEIV